MQSVLPPVLLACFSASDMLDERDNSFAVNTEVHVKKRTGSLIP
jgi:hypothetical protein